MRRIVFSDVVWDLVADEDDITQAVEEVWGDKGMLTVVLSSLADKLMVLRYAAIVWAPVPPSYTATFCFARIVRLIHEHFFFAGTWRLDVKLHGRNTWYLAVSGMFLTLIPSSISRRLLRKLLIVVRCGRHLSP
jgi:hypothetical protein